MRAGPEIVIETPGRGCPFSSIILPLIDPVCNSWEMADDTSRRQAVTPIRKTVFLMPFLLILRIRLNLV
jgi:hypothetical protein